MKSKLFVFGTIVLACFCCKPAANEDVTTTTQEEGTPAMTHADSVQRGEYLSYQMGCHDCHSPKVFSANGQMAFDTARLLSGHPASEALPKITDKSMIAPGQWILFTGGLTGYVGPWGTSYSANLTPDPSGTGEWTFEQFKTALTQGKYKGLENGRPIMPPMPWQNFAKMDPADMQSLWAYLRSLKPVNNVVPAYTPPTQG